MEVFEVYTTVPGLFVVEPLELLRTHLELDRDHALWDYEHRIDLLLARGEKLLHRRSVEGLVRGPDMGDAGRAAIETTAIRR